jgi:hypothetical protein
LRLIPAFISALAVSGNCSKRFREPRHARDRATTAVLTTMLAGLRSLPSGRVVVSYAISLVLVPFAFAGAATAQDPVVHDTIAEANGLRNARRFDAAVRLLRSYTAAHPDDPTAAHLLGETLYWLGERAAARAVYEAAIARHSSDVDLSLGYGRMLIEIGDRARASALLRPLAGTEASRGRAEVLLGLSAYWGGDYGVARRHFDDALAADSTLTEARDALRDILTVMAPRVAVAGQALHDDQPLDRLGMELVASAFVSPLVGVSARVEPIRFERDEVATQTLAIADATASAYFPAVRLEVDLAGGAVVRDSASAWTGRMGVGVRFPGRVVLRLRAQRAPYLHTVASLATPVMTRTLGATLDWSHPSGWLGQLAGTGDRFPDDNTVGTGFGWILAPIVRGRAIELRVGYAFTAQGAEESRFTIVSSDPGPSPSPGPGAGGPGPEGAYIPYYTPLDVRAHTALVDLALHPGRESVVRIGAGYGSARETGASVERRASMPPQPPTDVVVLMPRSFTPWNVRLSFDAPLSDGLALNVSAETMRTSFYRATIARVGVTRTFVTRRLRKLGPR